MTGKETYETEITIADIKIRVQSDKPQVSYTKAKEFIDEKLNHFGIVGAKNSASPLNETQQVPSAPTIPPNPPQQQETGWVKQQ